jgi:hypothetical protein
MTVPLRQSNRVGPTVLQDQFNYIPINPQSANYTTVASDASGIVLHPSTDNNPRTFTIDSNANCPLPVGSTIKFVNEANTLTIAVTSDTMTLAGGTSTGNRTLGAYGTALATKTHATAWVIEGVNLS